MATNIYIDSFNLYYGSLRGTPLKWLDLGEMCRRLLPRRDINRIRFFTARVNALPHDKQAPARQDTYLRALRTIGNLTIHEGRFASRPRALPRFPIVYHDPNKPPEHVTVMRTEEKRSDVNLASLLLFDCFNNEFDEAVVISNDSDLTLPIEIVVKEFGKEVLVINPHHRSKISKDLVNVATSFYGQINRKLLAESQFPAELRDSKGIIRKPGSW